MSKATNWTQNFGNENSVRCEKPMTKHGWREIWSSMLMPELCWLWKISLLAKDFPVFYFQNWFSSIFEKWNDHFYKLQVVFWNLFEFFVLLDFPQNEIVLKKLCFNRCFSQMLESLYFYSWKTWCNSMLS